MTDRRLPKVITIVYQWKKEEKDGQEVFGMKE
jgi:hypothetical protein